MRHLRLLAVFAPSVLLFALGACEDSENGAVAVTLPEAGLPDSASPAIDGAVPEDGGADVDAGPPLPVTVKVASITGSKADVRIILQDATGAVIGETKTDATGAATVTTAPSMITVLDSSGGQSSPVTFMGVAPGDVLRVVETDDGFDETILGTISTSFSDPNGVVANGNQFQVAASPQCTAFQSSIDTPIVLTLFAQCARPQNTLLTSAGNIGGTLGFAFMKNVTAPAGGNKVDVGPLAFAAAGTRTLAATNLTVVDGREYSTGAAAIVAADAFNLIPTGDVTTAPVSFKVPIGFADAFEPELQARETHDDGEFVSRVIRREPASAATTAAFTSVDFAQALPLITSVSVDAATPSRPTLTIGTPAATGAHTGYAAIQWFDNQSNGRWTFVFPGDAKTVTAPALPADATAFVPTSSVFVRAMAYLDGSLVPDYTTAKKLPISPNVDLDLTLTSPTLPLAGTVDVSLYRPVPK